MRYGGGGYFVKGGKATNKGAPAYLDSVRFEVVLGVVAAREARTKGEEGI